MLLATLVFFVSGLALGSFLNEQLLRFAPKPSFRLSWRSLCDLCGKKLPWWQLVPLLSQIMLKGVCHFCQRKIPRTHFWLELGVGLSTALLFWRFGSLSFLLQDNFIFLAALLFSLVLWFVALYDWRYLILPDGLMLPAIVLAFLGRTYWSGWENWLTILWQGLIPAAFFALLVLGSKGKWMGGGDIRLAALIGFLLPWRLALIAFIGSFFLGAIIGLSLIAAKKATRKTELPYAPLLAFTTLLAALWGDQILAWYLGFFF